MEKERLGWVVFVSIILLCFLQDVLAADRCDIPKEAQGTDSSFFSIYPSGDSPNTGLICTIYDESCWKSEDPLNACCLDRLCGEEIAYDYAYYVYNPVDNYWECKSITGPYTISYDDMKWACNKCAGAWDDDADNGDGECCGDDPIGNNPDGINSDDNGDDPDIGRNSCVGNLDALEEVDMTAGCPRGRHKDEPWKRHWSTLLPDDNNRCCGDDIEGGVSDDDCGAIVGNFLCTDILEITTSTSDESGCDITIDPECEAVLETYVNTSPQYWRWKDAANGAHTGVIISSSCSNPDSAYLSDGSRWIGCVDKDFSFAGTRFDVEEYGVLSSNEMENPLTTLEHNYICYYDQYNPVETFQIGECCGGTTDIAYSCNNDYQDSEDLGGQDFISGYSAEVGDKWFFCREDFKFSEELDCFSESEPDCDHEYACGNARNLEGDVMHYNWTGTKCCAEPADGLENYNDLGGEGACFNSTTIWNGMNIVGYTELTAVNGTLIGCNISATRVKNNNQWLLGVTDTHTEEPLIDEVGFCDVDPTGSLYCDYSEEWMETYDPSTGRQRNMSSLAYVPDGWVDVSVKGGCCEPGDCWNGSECYSNQAAIQPPNVDSHPPRDDGYRCSDGQWIYSDLKTGLDDNQGYCPRNNQCLISSGGDYEDNGNPEGFPQCLHDSQYIYDHYCEDGEWTSRTKLLALTLLDIVSDPVQEDYALYCGPYFDVLNYVDYTVGFVYVINLFIADEVNNLCLLDYDDKILLATSMNSHLNESAEEIGSILPEFENCDFSGDQGYVACNDGKKAWYNNNLKTLVYSKKGFELSPEPAYQTVYENIIEVRLNPLSSSLQNNAPTNSFSYGFLDDGLKFDYIYLAKKGSRAGFATLDQGNLIVRYEGQVSAKVQNIIQSYNESHAPDDEYQTARIASTVQGDSFNIVATGGFGTNIDPYFIWPDPTGRLRLE